MSWQPDGQTSALAQLHILKKNNDVILSFIYYNIHRMLLFCPSWSCTIICCINRFTSLCMNLFNLLEFSAEAFLLGSSSIENDAHGIEKLLLKSQVYIHYSARSRWTNRQHTSMWTCFYMDFTFLFVKIPPTKFLKIFSKLPVH